MIAKDIKYKIVTLLLLLTGLTRAQFSFNNLDSILVYADKNSSSGKISTQQNLLAKWTKVAALANAINFRSPVSFSATDNLLLPVNFIPAEAFGGPAGTFRQITLGQEYVTNFNFNPQIDLINPYNLAKIKSAELNKQLTEVNNQLIKKSLHESIAAAYYNIIALQEQLLISEKSLNTSDSVFTIVKNKFGQGIIREQDLNNALVNSLNVKDKLQQLKINLEQQLNSLKILCDIQSSTTLKITSPQKEITGDLKPTSSLQYKYSVIQNQYAKSEWRSNKLSMLPVLSLIYYQGWQKNSNVSYTDNASKWIQSKYIGFKLTVPFPPDVNKFSQNYASKVNYKIAGINSDHAKLQTELSNQTLALDYEKSVSSFEITKQIFELKNSNYQKSLNQYNEGILPTDNLLTAFMDMLNSELNMVAAHSAMEFNKSKIVINNSFK